MAEDWQPGDEALCISGDWPDGGPAAGSKTTVKRVEVSLCFTCARVHDWLAFDAWPFWFDADCFVKLRPHEPDAEDTEIIDLMKGKKVPEVTQ